MSRTPDLAPLPESPSTGCEVTAKLRDLTFLIVDDNPDGRFLIAKTLLRKFPNCAVVEAATADAAFRILEKQSMSLIVAHRTFDMPREALIRELRRRAPDVPLLTTSGENRREETLAAGADAFFTYDEWLMVGNAVVDLLDRRREKAAT